jgi:hypothetical protein
MTSKTCLTAIVLIASATTAFAQPCVPKGPPQSQASKCARQVGGSYTFHNGRCEWYHGGRQEAWNACMAGAGQPRGPSRACRRNPGLAGC